MQNNTGASVAIRVNNAASAAGQVGIYAEFSLGASADPILFSTYFTLTVNGVEQTVASNLPVDSASSYTPSNQFTFLCFANLNPGANTITLTVKEGASVGFNFYGFRFSSNSGAITGAAATPA